MTLRTRVGLAGGAVVLLALAVASLVVYPAVRSIMRHQVDDSLTQTVGQGDAIARQLKQKIAESGAKIPIDTPVTLGSDLVQFVSDPVYPGSNRDFIEITQRDTDVANGWAPAYFQDTTYNGVDYRVYTASMGKPPGALMRVARRLDDQSAILASLAALLVALTLGGGLVAAVSARLAARRVLRPVRMLTETVEHIATTHDLTAPVDHPTGRDEIGRLGQSFVAMTTALDASMRAQRQLVADASHELRTPLTSLTTNLELLADGDGLRAPEAPTLVRDAIGQARELRSLINNLVDLARYGKDTARTEDTRLDLVAKTVIAKAATRAAAPRFESVLTPCLVHVDPDAIERAVGNLVDNAVKWSPPGGEVRITVADGEFSITDEGPGIPATDLPFVFDRFYRSTQARSMPGSGLGLAIVRQVVETHGGQVAAEPLDHGLRMRFRLPVVPD
ncbi:HAMP domain-containing sensor histidine kinase [Actinocrispum wychmicini]|uniref:histidine kinase n=1 Tax=Actinocrispum wychmicini TaxID=1213861 RepID=A0A4R2JLD3_9PSEU|nr:HAMP domain-containing sensor histidine kinase [Actinocrispum wychmicini]TCO59392.1 two-component system sensor histidine kinase MprB [Actinocrispum wychmicini]